MCARRLRVILMAAAGVMVLFGGRADALTAGTGTVTVTINLIGRTLSISATFDSATYDLGVNLGPVGTVSATSVTLSNVDVNTGAAFVVPFANASNNFDAVGDIACPSGGCLAPGSGPYAFVGFLKNVNVSLLSAPDVYSFDGSATCGSGGPGILTCSGPFALNAFPTDPVPTGDSTIDRQVSFFDPITNTTRTFMARVILNGVTSSGTLSVAGLSRYRGAIPTGYATTSGSFSALFFDVTTDAVFTSGRVCVEDTIVDGTTLTVDQLAILHAPTAGGAFDVVPLVFIAGNPGFICADALTSLSPFVLLVNTAKLSTTTTATTTSTRPPSTAPINASTTTTTAPCTSARCIVQAAETTGACAGQTIPASVTAKFTQAETLIDQAATSPAKKAAKLFKKVRKALGQAGAKATRAAKGKKPKLSAACATALKDAAATVAAGL